ncbi:ABC-type oligopeptide transport system ATPase subunit [Amycolatopsis bartoniae]|uniref:ABC transporter ATP-binding protein n=1 Tax=Amycolatopsis bartoniae TaxID=941986 RepID=A0A8H9IY32_9PSEU|nr:ATP-binding cassette domain-containing protein [Amycolatopsis bartoniae]MBB2935321.1 ABC-type oligopeptide transport system ATPase subunit [Amycolatopsis bartoniae]TVT06778.1 ABC transporter ATP-binding protein [Amycolatopsis bartoniae]GHF55983.1 ABC transporter ATP-binding protein [Amycolatopsis bartoniae]
MPGQPLLEIENLQVTFGTRVTAVDGVSLHLDEGETLGLVGESGSGKSTLGNAVLGLVPVTGGRIRFEGEDITHVSPKRRRELGEHVQVVFQDPYGSLNPSRTIGHTITSPLRARHRFGRREAVEHAAAALAEVGLERDALTRFPAQFSGGQRQRIAIARALVLEPRLLICDEPTSALDLSVQAQILNLLLDLQERRGLSYLFISHDIDVVRHVSHRVAVLRRGRLVEQGPVGQVTGQPGHEYTRTLLAAVPVPDPHEQAARRARLRELLPSSH